MSSNSRPSGLGKKSLGQGGGSVASGHANQFSKKLKNPPEGQLCGTLPKCHFTPLKKQAYGEPTWSLPNDTFCRLMRQRLNSHVWKAKLFYWQKTGAANHLANVVTTLKHDVTGAEYREVTGERNPHDWAQTQTTSWTGFGTTWV